MPTRPRKTDAKARPLPAVDLEQSQSSFLAAMKRGRIPALLFTGPAGTGKELTAIDFARRLCCTADETCDPGEPACDSCRNASRLEHPGIHLVYPTPTQGSGEDDEGDVGDIARVLAEKRQDIFATYRFAKRASIRIARARAVIQRANTKPFDSAYNVFIFVDAHAMREEAQNALLKLVEEPPEHAVVIFITTNPEGILYTVRSRCQRVRFSPLKQPVIVRILEDYYEADKKTACRAAALAQGSIARARELVESFDDSDRERATAFVEGITRGSESWAVGAALTTSRGSNRDAVARFLDEVALVFRDVMAGEASLYINGDLAETLDDLVSSWEQQRLPAVIERIADARRQIQLANTNIDSTLAELFLDIRRASRRAHERP